MPLGANQATNYLANNPDLVLLPVCSQIATLILAFKSLGK